MEIFFSFSCRRREQLTALWHRIEASKPLVARLSRFRSHYIIIDDLAATFMFAGTETDYSGLINEFPYYEDFIVAIMDSLADLADLAKG